MGRIISYQNGWRASKTFPRLFHVEDGEDISTTTKPETWEYLRAQENEHRSRTWKERHNVGVPAYAYDEDEVRAWRGRTDHSQRQANRTNLWHVCPYIHTVHGGRKVPMVWVGEMIEGDWVIAAAFCNFHYKQSWLGKKGGIRG